MPVFEAQPYVEWFAETIKDRRACKECKGKNKGICADCNGEGIIVTTDEKHTYCDECERTGRISNCDTCHDVYTKEIATFRAHWDAWHGKAEEAL